MRVSVLERERGDLLRTCDVANGKLDQANERIDGSRGRPRRELPRFVSSWPHRADTQTSVGAVAKDLMLWPSLVRRVCLRAQQGRGHGMANRAPDGRQPGVRWGVCRARTPASLAPIGAESWTEHSGRVTLPRCPRSPDSKMLSSASLTTQDRERPLDGHARGVRHVRRVRRLEGASPCSPYRGHDRGANGGVVRSRVARFPDRFDSGHGGRLRVRRRRREYDWASLRRSSVRRNCSA
jgi:hypothetical protein